MLIATVCVVLAPSSTITSRDKADLDQPTLDAQCFPAWSDLLVLKAQSVVEEEMDEILPILQHVGEYIKEDDEVEFVRTMHEVSFPKWVYEEIPLLESEFFKQDLFDLID